MIITTYTHKPYGPYERFLKRPMDFFFSLIALLVLFPVLLILTIAGTIAMKGNPFFVQPRPGREERIFHLIKFRTMSNKKDKDGNLLPDTVRLNKYGRILRMLSLDELPSVLNILTGDLAIVGPRPLSVKYLPYYTEEERRRHSIRPGLTGLAQVSGRNKLSWEQKFAYDLTYESKITFWCDLKIILLTVKKVFIREGIGQAEEAPVSLHLLRQNRKIEEVADK